MGPFTQDLKELSTFQGTFKNVHGERKKKALCVATAEDLWLTSGICNLVSVSFH